MTAPKYCECGKKIIVVPHPKRNPHSKKNTAVRMKDHDLCRECWRNLLKLGAIGAER